MEKIANSQRFPRGLHFGSLALWGATFSTGILYMSGYRVRNGKGVGEKR